MGSLSNRHSIRPTSTRAAVAQQGLKHHVVPRPVSGRFMAAHSGLGRAYHTTVKVHANRPNTKGPPDSNAPNTTMPSWERIIAPFMLSLAAPVPKRFVMTGGNVSAHSSIFSTAARKVFSSKWKIAGSRVGNYLGKKRLYTHAVNGVAKTTAEWGPYIGRWGTRVFASAGTVLLFVDIADVMYTYWYPAARDNIKLYNEIHPIDKPGNLIYHLPH